MDIKCLDRVPAFITKDGSEIRELLAYRNSVIRKQSLAEARLPVGTSTQEHYHRRTEEIYFITQGRGRIRIGRSVRSVKPGDAIAIPPGQRHKLWNTGDTTLKLLCCCAPAYEHSDTVITEKLPRASRKPKASNRRVQLKLRGKLSGGSSRAGENSARVLAGGIRGHDAAGPFPVLRR